MIGQFATSKAGHDKGNLYVIVSEEEEFVYLADGRFKNPDAPKKKRRKHIQPIGCTVEEDLRRRLEERQCVQPEEIRFAIKKYSERQSASPK